MKITELNRLENEMIDVLRTRAVVHNDNEAARVLLEHLRCVGKDIGQWLKEKKLAEKQAEQPTK